jgi:predicted DNA-binding transcriptional regulator YafY
MLLQTPGGKARPITAAARAVELGISERPHYRDIAAITAKGAPIYGVDINVLQFVVIG